MGIFIRITFYHLKIFLKKFNFLFIHYFKKKKTYNEIGVFIGVLFVFVKIVNKIKSSYTKV